MHRRCVLGNMVHLSELLSGLSRIHHQNALTEKTWEDVVQGLGKWTALTNNIRNITAYFTIRSNFLLNIL